MLIFFEETEMKKLTTIGIGFYMIYNVFNILLVTGHTFGMKKFTYVSI